MAEEEPAAEEVLTPDAGDVQADPEEHKPEQGVELVARLDVDGDEFRVMSLLDEEQILDALQGRPSNVMVYSWRDKKTGKPVSGLSWAGVAECVRTMNAKRVTSIRVSPDVKPLVEEFHEANEHGEMVSFFRVMVYAEDRANGGGQWGIAHQPKFQTYKDPNKAPTLDPFAQTKALSKAQRNAMEPLVPLEFREVLVAQCLKDEARVKQIRAGAGAEQEAQLPPPVDDGRAKDLRKAIFETYDELKQVNRLALLPGRFNIDLQRSQHDHALLESFLERLRAQLAHEREKA